MSQIEKLIKKMQAKPTPKRVDFDEFKKYLEHFGFFLDRTKGSHNMFVHKKKNIHMPPIPTISGKEVKAAYVDQANEIILEMEEDKDE